MEAHEGLQSTVNEDDAEVISSNGVGRPASYLDVIKAKRRQLGEERLLTLAIPGYDGLLLARYHYIDGMYDDLKKIVDKADRSKNPRRELYAQIDILILACKEILVKAPEDDMADENGLVAIDPETTTRFDSHLAEILEFDAKRSRDVVYAIFQNGLTIAQQHNEIMEWAASNQVEIDEETAGESKGTTQSR
jgi:hypothetical protein